MSVSSINPNVSELLRAYRAEQIRNAETVKTPLDKAVERATDQGQDAAGAPAFEEVVTTTDDGFTAQSRFTGRDGRSFEGKWELGCLNAGRAWIAFTRPPKSCEDSAT
jgi:hypothetical protein